MEAFLDLFAELFVSNNTSELQRRLIATLVVLVLLWIVNRLLQRWIAGRVDEEDRQYRWQKVATYTYYAVTLIALGVIWFEGLTGLFAFLGLVAAGLVIALNAPVSNLAGWAFILWRQPFVVGDRIEVDEVSGDVVDISLFNFSLLEIGNWVDADQPTGRLISVPNGKVFTDKIANATLGFTYLWNEVAVLITFESDWKKAKGILAEIAEKHGQEVPQKAQEEFHRSAAKFKYGQVTLEPQVYTNVLDSGVNLTIRYICETRAMRTSADEIWEDILEAFALHDDIDLAYPTTRFYDARQEGPG